jgi:FKBP-type peptidyl-prolyl cis-trans isomerase
MLYLALLVSRAVARTEILTGDGKVKKVVIRDGVGRSPNDSEKALIHYTGFLPNGTVFDSSRTRKPLQFTIGVGVIRGWSIGVRSMRRGEIANLTIDHDYGYGERGYPPVIPPKATLGFEMELLAIGD